jgi:energy-coupling factor transporter ATP-binding protein EcfA2
MNPKDLIMRYAKQPIPSGTNLDFLGFSLANVIVNHRRYDAAIVAIAKLHLVKQTSNHGGGLSIYGPSGAGKSTIAKGYASNFQPYDEGRQTIMPVLEVTCPSSSTANGLMSAMFDAMGFPIPSRTDVAEKTIKISNLMKKYKVEIMLIDEFQHAYYSRDLGEFRLLIDTVKNIMNAAKVASVLFGLEQIDEVISTNEQVARRHSGKIEITTFQLDDEDDFKEFRALLKVYQAALVIPPEMPLYEANLARRFLVASNGNQGYLCLILEKSVEIAGFAGLSQISQEVYAAAFRESVWQGVPDKLNPFHDESPLRRLDRPGEPFYPWHLKHAIGSPLARRNIIKPAGS